MHILLGRLSGERWQTWQPKLRKLMVESFDEETIDRNSWFDPKDVNAAGGGRLFQTAINATTLSMRFRLPILNQSNYDRPKKDRL